MLAKSCLCVKLLEIATLLQRHNLYHQILLCAGTTARTFEQMTRGQCSSAASRIEDKSTCGYAASLLGLPDTFATSITINHLPYGCYYKIMFSGKKRLFWNLAGNKTADDTDRVALCYSGTRRHPYIHTIRFLTDRPPVKTYMRIRARASRLLPMVMA